jgi:hypothetical protein
VAEADAFEGVSLLGAVEEDGLQPVRVLGVARVAVGGEQLPHLQLVDQVVEPLIASTGQGLLEEVTASGAEVAGKLEEACRLLSMPSTPLTSAAQHRPA